MLDVFDHRQCRLGEGILWHAEREELFWVDIPDRTVMSAGVNGQRQHRFEEMVSALGVIDRDTLLLASETGLYRLAISDWTTERLCAVEASNPDTRSNDGRTDPWGGFWISTMGKNAEEGAGKIYRYYRGELREVLEAITIPNGQCFDRERGFAYHTDSATKLTWRMPLDEQGWPSGERGIFLDNRESGMTIDGAIIDASGNMYAALFDGAAVAKFGPDGSLLERLGTQTPRVTCPAFGGADWSDIFVTTAAIGLDPAPEDSIQHGVTLRFSNCVNGLPEPQFHP